MTPATSKGAAISEDGLYRYLLWRGWTPALHPQTCLWIGHNPSTADAETDDPTVLRMMRFTQHWGFNEMLLVNLIPLRTPDPKKAHEWVFGVQEDALDVIGKNAEALCAAVRRSTRAIACWGNIAAGVPNMSQGMKDTLHALHIPLYVLGLTKDGFPIHPLARGKNRIPDDIVPYRWSV